MTWGEGFHQVLAEWIGQRGWTIGVVVAVTDVVGRAVDDELLAGERAIEVVAAADAVVVASAVCRDQAASCVVGKGIVEIVWIAALCERLARS